MNRNARFRFGNSALAIFATAASLLFVFSSDRAASEETSRPTFDTTRPLSFPKDQGSHGEARIEWWYVTGHLRSGSGTWLGYQLTFFRTALRSAGSGPDVHLAHFALTDVSKGSFHFDQRTHRAGVGAAWAWADHLDVANEDWRLEELGARLVLHARSGWGPTLRELSLILTPEKALVLHGKGGVSRKGSEPQSVSRYVSYTRLKSEGWWREGDQTRAVEGTSWFDHEWGPGLLSKESAGWDWFALQLQDGRDLMLYRIRARNGGTTPFTSGTLVRKDGSSVSLAQGDFTIEETARWKSPRNGAIYPARWVIRLPREGIEAELAPLVADQELATESSTHVTYWEGACSVRSPGTKGVEIGRAYVELTGYAGSSGLSNLLGPSGKTGR